MKYWVLIILIIVFVATSHAGDTLTCAQVYNMHVGDTFDYKSETNNVYGNVHNTRIDYYRYVIFSMQYSTANDSLFIVRLRQSPSPVIYDTITVTRLDSFQIMETTDACMAQPYDVITDSIYYNRTMNIASYNNTDCGRKIWYAEGLGRIKDYWQYGIQGEIGYRYGTDELIYFSSNGDTHGTPYYRLNGQQLLSYTPIPEECATWIRTVEVDPEDMAPITFFQEKITTGNRIWHNGHTLVEMLYTCYAFDGITRPDSMIGYFRNDTLNHKAYLYDSYKTPFYTYDFDKTIGDSVSSIDTVLVGGERRTIWNRDCSASRPTGYIEGIGGANGLWPVRTQYYKPHQSLPFEVPACGTLTCFSVCGQTLYPNDSMTNCMLAVGIKETDELDKVSVYPTANNGSFYVASSGEPISFTLYDVVGKCVKKETITQAVQAISANNMGEGIFIYVLQNAAGKTSTGKLIITK